MKTLLQAIIYCVAIISMPHAATAKDTKEAKPYERPSQIDPEVWETLTPYFLPVDSPLKVALDSIFKKRNILKSKKALRQAGFLLFTPAEKIVVARHYKLRGYLIKAYLEKGEGDKWHWWKRRIDGANLIRESIARHSFEDLMKVPQKWIYPLPVISAENSAPRQRNFILVAEDMSPLNSYDNHKAYKKKMNPRLLEAFYTIVTENHLRDSLHFDNVPFCEDGKMAFLDTEHFNEPTKHLPLAVLNAHLTEEMKAHWKHLCTHGVR